MERKQDKDTKRVLVVEHTTTAVYPFTEFHGVELIYSDMDSSEESGHLSRLDQRTLQQYSESEKKAAYKQISLHSDELFRKHRKLVFIDVSAFKSSRYGLPDAKM